MATMFRHTGFGGNQKKELQSLGIQFVIYICRIENFIRLPNQTFLLCSIVYSPSLYWHFSSPD